MLQIHHPRRNRGYGGLGHGEHLAVAVVEPDGQLARQLEVLALVIAHGHQRGVVEEDVRRHQDRIGEQPDPDRLLRPRLVLELRHPPQLAHGRGALEEPGQAWMLGDMALEEEGAPVRVETRGQEQGRSLERSRAERFGVDVDGQGVEVHEAVEGLVVVLEGDPVAQRSQVIAEMEVAGGLDPREDSGHGRPW